MTKIDNIIRQINDNFGESGFDLQPFLTEFDTFENQLAMLKWIDSGGRASSVYMLKPQYRLNIETLDKKFERNDSLSSSSFRTVKIKVGFQHYHVPVANIKPDGLASSGDYPNTDKVFKSVKREVARLFENIDVTAQLDTVLSVDRVLEILDKYRQIFYTENSKRNVWHADLWLLPIFLDIPLFRAYLMRNNTEEKTLFASLVLLQSQGNFNQQHLPWLRGYDRYGRPIKDIKISPMILEYLIEAKSGDHPAYTLGNFKETASHLFSNNQASIRFTMPSIPIAINDYFNRASQYFQYMSWAETLIQLQFHVSMRQIDLHARHQTKTLKLRQAKSMLLTALDAVQHLPSDLAYADTDLMPLYEYKLLLDQTHTETVNRSVCLKDVFDIQDYLAMKHKPAAFVPERVTLINLIKLALTKLDEIKRLSVLSKAYNEQAINQERWGGWDTPQIHISGAASRLDAVAKPSKPQNDDGNKKGEDKQ